MPRQRMIKPKFWEDKKIGKLRPESRLMYIGMWNFADDKGVLSNDPVLIKARIFPYDKDMNVARIAKMLQEMEEMKLFKVIEWNGDSYIYIHNFLKHQKINKPNLDELNIPVDELEKITDESRNDHGLFTDESRPKREEEEKISKEEREEKKKEDLHPLLILPFDDQFKNFWVQWKNYRSKQHGFKYKSVQSEQAAVNDLCNKAKGIKEIAIAMIQQSMSKGWKDFYELKNFNSDAKFTSNKTDTGKPSIATDVQERLKARFAGGQPVSGEQVSAAV